MSDSSNDELNDTPHYNPNELEDDSIIVTYGMVELIDYDSFLSVPDHLKEEPVSDEFDHVDSMAVPSSPACIDPQGTYHHHHPYLSTNSQREPEGERVNEREIVGEDMDWSLGPDLNFSYQPYFTGGGASPSTFRHTSSPISDTPPEAGPSSLPIQRKLGTPSSFELSSDDQSNHPASEKRRHPRRKMGQIQAADSQPQAGPSSLTSERRQSKRRRPSEVDDDDDYEPPGVEMARSSKRPRRQMGRIPVADIDPGAGSIFFHIPKRKRSSSDDGDEDQDDKPMRKKIRQASVVNGSKRSNPRQEKQNWSCAVCKRKFGRKHDLKRHRMYNCKAAGTEGIVDQCSHPGCLFSSRGDSVRRHEGREHQQDESGRCTCGCAKKQAQ